MIDMYFLDMLLNIRPTTYVYLYVIVCIFLQFKASGCAHVVCSSHKRSQAKSSATLS